MTNIPRLKLNTYLLPILTGITLVMQLVDGSKVWLLLFSSLGMIWLISCLWARSLARNLSLKREMRFGWAQVGDTLEERLSLVNLGWASALWVEIRDHSDLPDHDLNQVTAVGMASQNQWRTRTLCTRRGLYTLGPTTLETSDPFGLYTITLRNPDSAHLMVMPPSVPLPDVQIAPGGRLGEGRPRQNAPERSVSVASVREYIPGDSLHTIHWPTTARRDEPYVQVFDGTPAGDWWIVLDLDRRSQVGEGWDSTVELGVILATSLAERGLKARHAVGLISNSEKTVWLPPQEGANHRWEILRSLALVNPGETAFAALLERARPAINQRSSAILITPDVRGEWISPLMKWLWRGITPTVLLLDPASFTTSVKPQLQEPGSAQATASLLSQMGLSCSIITHDMLDRPELRPGRRGQWEWRIMPTGRAVPIHQPEEVNWKTLTQTSQR